MQTYMQKIKGNLKGLAHLGLRMDWQGLMVGQGKGPVHPAGRGAGDLLTTMGGAIGHLPLNVHIFLDREGHWGWLSQGARKDRARLRVIWWTTWGIQD